MKPPIEDIMKAFYTILDKEADAIDKPCKKGCDYCCYHAIYVSFLEGYYVKSFLEHLPDARFQIIKDEWLKWMKTCSELNLFSRQLATPQLFAAHNQIYDDHKIKCPFLLDNECSIYEVRPIICRTFFTFTTPDMCSTERPPEVSDALCKKKHRQIILTQQFMRPDTPLSFSCLPYDLQDLFL
jgi:Fe-S-cluster containining protein